MKPTLFLFSLLISGAILAQKPCCSANEAFVALGSDATFSASHQLPKQVKDTTQTGAFITFRATDSTTARGYYVAAEVPSDSYLLIFHEWWGLNQNIVNEAEKWAAALPGTNVLALDLYDGKVATTRQAASEFMQSADETHIRAIIQGAINKFGTQAKIATIGWCFGGGWSMQAALMAEKQAVGCVVYYGMPESDTTQLASLNCKVLGIFAEQDKWINREVVAKYEQAMKVANKPFETIWYDAEHAFANPSNPVFNETAADDARKKTLDFLQQSLYRNN